MSISELSGQNDSASSLARADVLVSNSGLKIVFSFKFHFHSTQFAMCKEMVVTVGSKLSNKAMNNNNNITVAGANKEEQARTGRGEGQSSPGLGRQEPGGRAGQHLRQRGFPLARRCAGRTGPKRR